MLTDFTRHSFECHNEIETMEWKVVRSQWLYPHCLKYMRQWNNFWKWFDWINVNHSQLELFEGCLANMYCRLNELVLAGEWKLAFTNVSRKELQWLTSVNWISEWECDVHSGVESQSSMGHLSLVMPAFSGLWEVATMSFWFLVASDMGRLFWHTFPETLRLLNWLW